MVFGTKTAGRVIFSIHKRDFFPSSKASFPILQALGQKLIQSLSLFIRQPGGDLLLRFRENILNPFRHFLAPGRQRYIEGTAVVRAVSPFNQSGVLHPQKNIPHRGRLNLAVIRNILLFVFSVLRQILEDLRLPRRQAERVSVKPSST